MASFLSLVAGVVIGLLAGWLLRGRMADKQPIAVAEPEPVVEPELEPVAATAADAEPVAVAEPEPIAVAEPEPIAEPEPVAVPEPVAAAEPEATPEPVAVSTPDPIAEPVTVQDEADELAAVPAPGAVAVAEPDDLTKIPGIGPKSAMALAAAGITTYRQVADADTTALRAAITAAGLRSAPGLASWPERAKQLLDTTA